MAAEPPGAQRCRSRPVSLAREQWKAAVVRCPWSPCGVSTGNSAYQAGLVPRRGGEFGGEDPVGTAR